MSTAARTWAHAPQLVTWAEGDYCVFGRNPQAVRARMGEYFPAGRYLSTAEVESLARASKSPDAAAAAEAQVGTHDRTLTVDGRRRSYRLYVPAAHPTTRRLPLVIALHGGQSSGHEMEVLTGLSALAEREQFLAVYPDAIGVYRDKRYWNDGRVPEVDDVKFIGMLIDELVRSFAADPARVYVTGISNGASMTNRLGVALAERIAAIAPVAGTIGVQAADRWQPARPLPVVYFHGTADPLAYYDGGSAGTYRGSALSAPDYVRWWARHNGCAAAARSEPLPDATADGTRVTRVAHDGCRVGAEVVLYRIESGGHTWPGGRQYLPERVIGKTSRDIDANAVMWEFFKRHPLP
jgi:polyhydroxybutyrate depolymerase